MLNKSLFLLIFFTTYIFAQIAQVVALKGDVQVQRELTIEKLILKDEIFKNDQITSAKDSRTQLLFEDETIITIGENSVFKVNDYLFDEEKKTDLNVDFINGTFKIITGKIGKLNPDSFKLHTKTAAIGIRGTEILLELEPELEKIVCTHGSILVTMNETNKMIILNVGESLSINLITNEVNVEKIDDEIINKISSSLYNNKIDRKYDEWIKESTTINYLVNDAFSKGHKVDYSATTLNGTINEQTDGLSTFDTSNASFDLSIDFGKARDNNPVTGDIEITTATQTSVNKYISGNIDTSNKINLFYETNSTTDPISTGGNLEFVDKDLNIKGSDLSLKTYYQNEVIKIDEVEFKAK